MRRLSGLSLALFLWLGCIGNAQAAFNYLSGYIIGITYLDDSVMVMLNTGVPDNCVGSPSGWIQIPATNKAMQGYVTGLWLAGNASQTPVYIYTQGLPSPGAYCLVKQINPQS
jgi:hypothetical protein